MYNSCKELARVTRSSYGPNGTNVDVLIGAIDTALCIEVYVTMGMLILY